VGILTTEFMLCWKYRKNTGNILNNPTPLWVSIPWAIFFITIAVTWVYLRFKPDRTKKFPQGPAIKDGYKSINGPTN